VSKNVFCVLLILKIHPHYFNWYLNCNGHTCARLESSMYTFTRVPCQTWSAMIQSTTWKDDSLVWLSWFLTAQDTRINQIRIDLNVQIVNIPKVPDRFAHREGFVLFIFETLTRLIIKFRLIKRVKRKVKLSEVINKYVVCRLWSFRWQGDVGVQIGRRVYVCIVRSCRYYYAVRGG